MGFMDKIKGMINPESIDDNYDDEYVFDGDDENGDYQDNYDENYQQQNQQNQQNQDYNSGVNQSQNQNPGQAVSFNTNNTEIKVVRPVRFDSVKQIAEHLLSRRSVILNLEKTNKETAHRMIDFLSGVAFSINGNLRIVSNNTFVITPDNVDVTEQQIQAQQAQAQRQQGQRININDPYNNGSGGNENEDN